MRHAVADHRPDRAARGAAGAAVEPRGHRLHLLADPRRGACRRSAARWSSRARSCPTSTAPAASRRARRAVEDTMTYGDPQTAVAPVRPARAAGSSAISPPCPSRADPLARGLSQRAHPAARPDHAARRRARHPAPAQRPVARQRPHFRRGPGASRDARKFLAHRRWSSPACSGSLCGLILAQYVGQPDRRHRRGRRPHQRPRPDASACR